MSVMRHYPPPGKTRRRFTKKFKATRWRWSSTVTGRSPGGAGHRRFAHYQIRAPLYAGNPNWALFAGATPRQSPRSARHPLIWVLSVRSGPLGSISLSQGVSSRSLRLGADSDPDGDGGFCFAVVENGEDLESGAETLEVAAQS